MANIHIGGPPPYVPGGYTIVTPEIPVGPYGSVHGTSVVTPQGGVVNSHLTYTGPHGPKISVWP